MPQKRELFVNSVRSVPVYGAQVTPTAIRYNGKSHVIGYEALELEYSEQFDRIFDNFKIELGTGEYSQLASKANSVSKDIRRSIVGVAQDFMLTSLAEVEAWCHHRALVLPKHILVAEPLALEDSAVTGESWLANYRANVRRILHRFDEVDFLPEPFAMFQYYRYGVRHPLIAEKRKHTALVLDFGGGAFDVSVVETTGQGDISQSGRNQRPLAAKSIAVAGNFINRKVAESLMFNAFPDVKKNKVARNALDFYDKRHLIQSDPTIRPEVINFLANFDRAVRSVEKAKIAICSGIANWDLGANLSAKIPVRVQLPSKPFSEQSDIVEVTLDAAEFREIFEREVWQRRLKGAIIEVIRRADVKLQGGAISVVLLSGGSSNIGWLRSLIERDLSIDLNSASIVELSENFQEIVAKGLAIECARRYYTDGEGDFQAVLYNRLCLLLAPNQRPVELKRFRPVAPASLPESGEDGVLLPSASGLRAHIDQELQWKVRLSASPSQTLEYHFMRSSFDPSDSDGLLNVMQRSVATPRGAAFGQAIDISLRVREDGTAEPTFIYGKGNASGERRVVGTPFFLDMTTATGAVDVPAYIGFDFGSSTSSFSLVSRSDVKVYQERSNNAGWRELSDLISDLPYPVAVSLARYLGEASADNVFKRGREVLESALTFLAYTTLCIYRSGEWKVRGALFKGLRNRSAGPLWALLRESLAAIPHAARQSLPVAKLLTDQFSASLDDAVNEVAKEKHDKQASVDFNAILRPLCNTIVDSMKGKLFGIFLETRQRPFSVGFDGLFRSLTGPREPFVSLWNYTGSQSISGNEVYLVDTESGKAICLTPMYVWGLNSIEGDSKPPDLYVYDKSDRDSHVYNSQRERREIYVTEKHLTLGSLHSMLEIQRGADVATAALTGVQLTSRNEGR